MSSSSSWGISTGPIEVPQYFQDGEKFVKWDEDSNAGLLVTLRVDPKGFFLYWTDQNMEVDMLDITNIRDVRTGQYAKVPKEGKLRALVSIGASACSGSLEEKTVSVCWGTDFVNVAFANFCCATKDMAQKWTTWLFELAYNINQLNPSPLRLLEKIHMKIQLKLDRDKMLPVNNIVRAFASAKEERRRVLAAMAEAGLPSDKGARLPADTFTFDRFMRLYRALTARDELVEVFLEASEGEQTLTPNRLAHFLNTQQRDPRLNEVLHPYADEARALELVRVHETDAHRKEQGVMTFDGFLRFLLSDDSPPIAPNRLQLSDDMERPMAHYFINSSHNTYLTGHQITGKSSVEMYRQSLLAGCRCVELDLWNGRTDEPIIVHGYTFVPEVLAKDVLEAIAESAFKTSEYPVVLSFENHCNARQQAKVAQYCREIFGDMLLDRPMESHPLRPGGELPSPHSLRRKIIIKNKKKHHHHHHHHRKDIEPILVEPPAEPPADNNGLADHNEKDEGKESSTSESESSSGEEEACADSQAGAETQAETHAGEEISALVNYVQPVHFTSFENAEKKSRFYEMSSFDEKQAATLLKERPVEFVNYNKWQLSRVYPAGTRFDSSNFMPQVFWNAGCQLVALNYQTMDAPMQLNLGAFECNRRCGYLLKPEFMRRADRRLDPFAERTVDGVVAGSLAVRVVSAQLASERRCSTSVEVDLLGLPADTVRKRYRTKAAPHNGLNPRYQPETFHFRKVVMPELAWLRLALLDEGGRLLGQRVLPLASLRQGWRHVPLRGEGGRALAATLLLHVAVADYVPDRLAELADALSNPIKYQSELDRRDHQLRALMDDAPAEEDAAPAPTVATPAPVAVVSSEPDPAPSGPVAADTPEEERLGSSCEELHLVLQCRAAELKRTELNRKLEALKRKPTRLQARLVKRLSVLNVSGGSSEVSEADAERELRLRYHHAVFLALDNHAKNIHQQQMKALTDLLETEKKEILNRLANARKEDVKAMLKKTNRDKDEIVRIKREIHSQSVERGVAECSRLEAQYERKREQVARRHERVARRLQKLKAEQLARLNEEYADLT